MDFPQEETRGKKIVLAVLIFLFVLILGIIGARLYFQNKTKPAQKPNNTITPAPAKVQEPSDSNVPEPSNIPDMIPQPPENERVPPPLP
jgi:flagellar basal body-associated protein FliL